MKIIQLIIFLSFSLFGYSQSYVFLPKIDVEKHSSDTGSVYIAFKDSRIYEKKVKEKSPKEEIFTAFANYIKIAFPNVRILILDDSAYSKNPIANSLTYKIDLKKYEATFYPGVYIAKTEYTLNIYDLRNGIGIYEHTFSGEGKRFNALGLKSGKIASNSSFKRAFDPFKEIFNKGLKGTLETAIANQPELKSKEFGESKAERLRELKELLDEGILTQEEFDKEKKKILNEK